MEASAGATSRHFQRLTMSTLRLARPRRGTVWLSPQGADVCAGIPGPVSSLRCSALWGGGSPPREPGWVGPAVPSGLQVGSVSGGPGRRSESRRETHCAPPASSLPWVQVSETAAAFTTPPPSMSSGKNTSHLGRPTTYLLPTYPTRSRHNQKVHYLHGNEPTNG